MQETNAPGPLELGQSFVKEHFEGELQEKLLQHFRPCFQGSIDTDASVELGKSKHGGIPDVPTSFEWPRNGERPLVFVAQVALQEIEGTALGLPASGMLYFFVDFDYDPEAEIGEEPVRVVYTESTEVTPASNAPETDVEPRRIVFTPSVSTLGPTSYLLRHSGLSEPQFERLLELQLREMDHYEIGAWQGHQVVEQWVSPDAPEAAIEKVTEDCVSLLAFPLAEWIGTEDDAVIAISRESLVQGDWDKAVVAVC